MTDALGPKRKRHGSPGRHLAGTGTSAGQQALPHCGGCEDPVWWHFNGRKLFAHGKKKKKKKSRHGQIRVGGVLLKREDSRKNREKPFMLTHTTTQTRQLTKTVTHTSEL